MTVTVLNINAGNNAELLGKCKTLREYMQYIERVRAYAVQMPISEAVEEFEATIDFPIADKNQGE